MDEPTIPSNEQIIDDLTKELRNSCGTTQSNSTSTRAEYGSDDDKDSADENLTSLPTGMEEDDKSDFLQSEGPCLDFIDEEALKDREVTLTEDEKRKLRDEADVLKNEGNTFFKAGEYTKAHTSYTEGLQICPLAYAEERAILYANRAAAKMKHMVQKDQILTMFKDENLNMQNVSKNSNFVFFNKIFNQEDKEPAIADCTKAIELNPKYLKAYLRRAQLHEETNKLDNALEDFKKILELDPSHSEANHAVRRLPPLIEEANEKLKAEMLGKLKDLGNLVLKPFGLSTNNFELQQDPNSGGYSVKFNQNPS
ncbi:tetratricopeptide repeat protein 1 isoform X1 [Venturia canescens]|uniref:tetratricopeptide repeat protein 1 isoform X1 n=1 Tax=Venturia canescens TaxID=32260 RepID=UPI001C9CDE16|nr:tetratricopeptide repeat protein 1 isoform X1 [Venturia canescens]